MSIWEKLRAMDAELDEKMDLEKRFPGYFTKAVFRVMALAILAVAFMAAQSSGWSLQPTIVISCAQDSPNAVRLYEGQLLYCENPFYQCQDLACATRRVVTTPCPDGYEGTPLCTQEKLAPGEIIGEPPGWWIQNGVTLVWVIMLAAFVVNHVVYEVRKRW